MHLTGLAQSLVLRAASWTSPVGSSFLPLFGIIDLTSHELNSVRDEGWSTSSAICFLMRTRLTWHHFCIVKQSFVPETFIDEKIREAPVYLWWELSRELSECRRCLWFGCCCTVEFLRVSWLQLPAVHILGSGSAGFENWLPAACGGGRLEFQVLAPAQPRASHHTHLDVDLAHERCLCSSLSFCVSRIEQQQQTFNS